MTMYNRVFVVLLVNHFEIMRVLSSSIAPFFAKSQWQNTCADAKTPNLRRNGRAVQCMR